MMVEGPTQTDRSVDALQQELSWGDAVWAWLGFAQVWAPAVVVGGRFSSGPVAVYLYGVATSPPGGWVALDRRDLVLRTSSSRGPTEAEQSAYALGWEPAGPGEAVWAWDGWVWHEGVVLGPKFQRRSPEAGGAGLRKWEVVVVDAPRLYHYTQRAEGVRRCKRRVLRPMHCRKVRRPMFGAALGSVTASGPLWEGGP